MITKWLTFNVSCQLNDSPIFIVENAFLDLDGTLLRLTSDSMKVPNEFEYMEHPTFTEINSCYIRIVGFAGLSRLEYTLTPIQT